MSGFRRRALLGPQFPFKLAPPLQDLFRISISTIGAAAFGREAEGWGSGAACACAGGSFSTFGVPIRIGSVAPGCEVAALHSDAS